jgi:ATP-dependent Clp protease ATP-binding subunit ClpA
LQVKDLEERVEEMGYFIHFTKGAIEELAKVGFDQKYGARTLSRAIQQLVEVPISTLVINNKIPKGSSFRVIKSRIDGSIKVEVQ